MNARIELPEDLIKEIEINSPFPWTQHVHPNGLIQVGDRNNKEVSIILIIKVAMEVGVSLLQSSKEAV